MLVQHTFLYILASNVDVMLWVLRCIIDRCEG